MDENFLTQQAADYQRVEAAIRFLEANFRRQPGLDEIAQAAHLSKYHFQRLFKRWAGISPTQFVHMLTVDYAKERLRASQSVLDAALDAGLSGPGRLHDLFVTLEAITPGEYKALGAGLRIAYGFHDTPFGRCLLATTPRGICALFFVVQDDASTLEILSREWPRASLVADTRETRPMLDHIFAPARLAQPQPLHLLLKGTNFQVQVWQALLTIPSGAVVSYGGLAAHLGRPHSARAVASAVARNPVSYLIPCHRVIGEMGQMRGYRWGIARKRAMLAWEAR